MLRPRLKNSTDWVRREVRKSSTDSVLSKLLHLATECRTQTALRTLYTYEYCTGCGRYRKVRQNFIIKYNFNANLRDNCFFFVKTLALTYYTNIAQGAGGAKNDDRTLLFGVTLIQTSVMTVSFLSKHSSGPGCKRQPEGPHNSLGTFLQSVSGEYFKTVRCSVVQTSLGHVVHFYSVKIGNINFTTLKILYDELRPEI